MLREFIQFRLRELENIIEEIKDINTEKSKERYLEISAKIKDYKGVLEEIEG